MRPCGSHCNIAVAHHPDTYTHMSAHTHTHTHMYARARAQVLSINGQTGLSNTEAAAMLREETGTIVVVLRKCIYLGQPEPGYGYTGGQEPVSTPTPETPRSAMRRPRRRRRSRWR